MVLERDLMAGFTLHTSNRLEILADGLIDSLKRKPSSPFTRQTVLVQSKGMERWISMQVARQLGICANIEFPFPNAFIHRLFCALVDEDPEGWAMDSSVLAWKVMELLRRCTGAPGFETVDHYLQRDGSQLRRYQLARRLATLFDQYLVFRPEMILRWEAGEEDHWQARLWREITGGRTVLHAARLKQMFHVKCREGGFPTDALPLPEHLAVFGISNLPPFHMQVIGDLSYFVSVDFFLLNPCREYWADIRSEREMSRLVNRSVGSGFSMEELHLESGNSLLASLGTLGRDFFDLVRGLDPDERESFLNPGEDTLLHALQSDILELSDRRRGGKLTIARQDRSLVVHSCHSPMREVEVLHDQLLAMLDEDPTLRPWDILVMTPDIHLYTPVIQAVFETLEDPGLRIPYAVADKTLRRQSRVVEAFLGILDLPDSRFTVGQVLPLLDHEPVRRRFDLSQADLGLVRRWIEATRIRWGIDGDHRAELGMKPTAENTWKAGVTRLLLGYAMRDDGSLFQGILPYDPMEGSETAVLGKLLDFLDRLSQDARRLAHPRVLSDWGKVLSELLDSYLEADPTVERELLFIRKTLHALSAVEDQSGNREPITLEVIRSVLKDHFESEGTGSGFLSGGVTFCALLPMRSIPFRVIWLLGMNDDAFPRHEPALGFDLMQKNPKKGDRSQRKDDRYLFLEALLSARDRFVVSHVGQSLRDNSPIPPSVVVSELLEVVERGFDHPDGDILRALVTRHPLQLFNPQRFTGSDNRGCFSYSRENCRAAMVLREARVHPAAKFSVPLDDPEAEWREVAVTQLVRFFSNPSRFFLRERLKVELGGLVVAPEESEPFLLEGLERYQVGTLLLNELAGGGEAAALLPTLRAAGELPHGTVGYCAFDRVRQAADSFYQQISSFLEETLLPPVDIQLEIGPFCLRGRIDRITSRGLIHYRNGRARAKDLLELWIRHLMVGLHPGLKPPHSLLLGMDRAIQLLPATDGMKHLASLLDLYWQGLSSPLPFFPQSSLAFARAILQKGKSEREALKAARGEWLPNSSQDIPKEGEETYVELCFRNGDPLGPAFQATALAVFEPLLALEGNLD